MIFTFCCRIMLRVLHSVPSCTRSPQACVGHRRFAADACGDARHHRGLFGSRARAKVWGGEVGVWIVCSWAPSTSGKGVGSPSGTRVAQIDHHTSSYILIHNTFSGSTWSRKFHGRHSVVALHSKAAVVPEWSLVLVLVASKTEFKPPIRIQIRRATVYIGVSKRLEIQKHRPGNIESYPSHSMQYFQSIRFLKVYICDIPQKRPKPDAPPKKNMYL